MVFDVVCLKKKKKKTMENRAWKFVDPFVLVRSLKDLSRNVIWFIYRLKMSANEMFWEKRKKQSKTFRTLGKRQLEEQKESDRVSIIGTRDCVITWLRSIQTLKVNQIQTEHFICISNFDGINCVWTSDNTIIHFFFRKFYEKLSSVNTITLTYKQSSLRPFGA